MMGTGPRDPGDAGVPEDDELPNGPLASDDGLGGTVPTEDRAADDEFMERLRRSGHG